jgi:hypothetical protein
MIRWREFIAALGGVAARDSGAAARKDAADRRADEPATE